MADVELVIKIPETLKKITDEEDYKTFSHPVWLAILMDRIINGTPLPKGHGRLIDADALEQEMENGINAGLLLEGYEQYGHINDMDDCLECVKYAPPIIEADKGDKE